MPIDRIGNLIIGTEAERVAMSTTNLVNGTRFYEINTFRTVIWSTTNGWELPPFTHHLPANTYTAYIAGTMVKLRNNRTGLVDFSNSNDPTTGDFVPPVKSAINNIKNILNSGIDVNFGATIGFMSGRYNGKTELLMSSDVAQASRHGIGLVGEGPGNTLLYWTPSSTLPNAINISKMNGAQVRSMTLWGNSLTTKLINITGPTLAEGQRNEDLFESVYFCGANSGIPTGLARGLNTGTNVVANQTGIYTSNPDTAGLVACCTVTNCRFFGLDYAGQFLGQHTDMWFHDNLRMDSCRIGYLIEGVQHVLNNIRNESSGLGSVPQEIGEIGIHIKYPPTGAGGNINFLNNINGELRGTGAILVKIESPCANNHLRNVFNSGGNDIDNFRVWDENVQGINFDYDSRTSEISPEQTIRRVGYITGTNHGISVTDTYGPNTYNSTTGWGTLAPPNVRENVSSGASITAINDTSNTIAKKLTTGTTINNMASLQYVHCHHTRPSNMRIFGRFRLVDNTSIRVFIGFIRLGNPTPPTLFSVPTATSDILDSNVGIGLWADSAVSSGQWKVAHNNGTAGASVKDAITANPTLNTALHKFEIITDDTANRFGVRLDNVMNIVTATIPATGDRYGWLVFIQATAGSASRDLYLYSINMMTIR